ncbi:MAG: ComF family protein [Cyclobacteriaceae bacterium]|nr:ComF family protein [Cyclobacteriaceae bacterium]
MQRFYGRVPLTEAHAFLFFKRKGITQKLLHEIKYNGNQKLAIDLGKTFGENCVKERLFQSIDLIIPVPLHKSKYRLRGYNQSELIAMGMADKLGAELDTAAVVRSVKTSTQTKKSRSERWKNVSEIFKANTNRLKGRHVLVVDDVVTTGATLESCAQSILDAGALDVSIACLALA